MTISSPSSSRGLIVRALLDSAELVCLFCKQYTESEFRASKSIACFIGHRDASLVVLTIAGRTCENKMYEVEPRPNKE